MRMVYVLAGAVVAAGAFAFFGGGLRSTPSVAPETPNAPATSADPAQAGEEPGRAMGVLEGEALETLDVPGYTYIRVGQKGTDGEWVAVSSAQLKVGDQVRFQGETVMTNFESPTLKRKFPSIRFGTLAGEGAQAGANPHAATGAMGAPAGRPSAAAPAEGDVVIGKIDKADGPNGRRIEEVFAQKQSLAGKPVRVRGVIVKATSGVMGKNFIHLRDGSGSDAKKNNDLTLTTIEAVERGQTVLLEGVVTLDKDLGAGYRYDVLIEDATTPK